MKSAGASWWIGLQNGPVVVAGVARFPQQLYPKFGCSIRQRRQHPVKKNLFFFMVAVGINLDITTARRDALRKAVLDTSLGAFCFPEEP